MDRENGSQPSIAFGGRVLIPALWGIFGITVLAGIFLSVYYVPTFAQAFSSVQRLNEQIPFGWWIRRIHAGGGYLLLILTTLYLIWLWAAGAYRWVSRRIWLYGILFWGLAIFTHFSGTLLPLSQSAFWGTNLVLSNISLIPAIGGGIADFLRGGKELSSGALLRFYSMHLGFPLIMILLFFAHTRPVAKLRGEGKMEGDGKKFLLWAVLALLLLATTGFSASLADSLGEMANPLQTPDRSASPFYFLFLEETLKFFSQTDPGLAFLFFVLLPLLIVFLPWIDRGRETNLLQRPFALSIGVALAMIFLYFSFVGLASARYGERVILPDRPLAPMELRGARIYIEKNCAYCHQIYGREGRREGPDMSVLHERGRSLDWIRRFTFNARRYQPGSTMPRYDMPVEDLEALSHYLVSLDGRTGRLRAVDRREFLDFGFERFQQGEKPREREK
jgi:quinol-cytochrome oxidoreductase complex cytochrome b subunit